MCGSQTLSQAQDMHLAAPGQGAQLWIVIKDSHESLQMSLIPTEGGEETSAKGSHILE